MHIRKIVQLTQTMETGREAYFYADGKRISRTKYEDIITSAPRKDCYLTRSKYREGGKIWRINYVSCYF